MAVKGIDVSHYNGDIDWNQVANSGVTFAMIHAGYGESLENIDPTFRQNVEGALAAGVNVGLSWFSYAYTVDMAKVEAKPPRPTKGVLPTRLALTGNMPATPMRNSKA